MREFYIHSGWFAFLTNILLALFVLSRNRRNPPNLFFVIFVLSIGFWSIGSSIVNVIPNKTLALRALRLCYLPAAFLPTLFVHFTHVLIGRMGKNARKFLIGSYLVSGVFAAFTPTNYFVAGLRQISAWEFRISFPGPVYYFFLAFFILWVGYALVCLNRASRRESGIVKIQLQYIFISYLVAAFAGIEYFTRVFGIISSPPLDDYILVCSFGVFAYALVRYQLLEIEVVIKRTLVFAGLAGSVVMVVSFMTFVSQDVLARFVAIPRFWSNILAAIVIAATYGRIRNWLVNITDRYLFQKRYDYKELLKKFTDEVMVIVDLKQLLQMTVNALTETIKLEGCSLLLLDKDKRSYELAAGKGVTARQVSLADQEPFITFLRETHEPIKAAGKVHFPLEVTDRLKQLKAQLCLPLNLHEDLIGVLCLGKKKSDEEFTNDDFDILLPLARTLAIAVSNAQLFDTLAKTQAEAAQKEKLAVIGTLSAGINHEICNPLGIVKTQSEAFLLDLQDGLLRDQSPEVVMERISKILSGTLKQIDRATAITQKLSNFAKPIKEPTAQPVSVEHEVEEVLALVGHDLKLERIEVAKEIPTDLPSIVVDRRQLQEVLFNLIRNAGQAIAPPGRITVRARSTAEGQVRIEIQDTGSGIPPDKLSKIYDPFFTTKEPGKGTGLGLFIVRQIIERNKGRISVESEVGKGTTFFLEFPAAKMEPAGQR